MKLNESIKYYFRQNKSIKIENREIKFHRCRHNKSRTNGTSLWKAIANIIMAQSRKFKII